MADKMYYSEEEAAAKLGVSVDELAGYVRDDKLRVFQDGARKMFKADEVDALLGGVTQPMDSGEIDLAPAGESDIPTAEPPDAADIVTIGDIGEPLASGAEDTVITAEGISIFDEEDLEIEAADPMAKTQIAPSLEDQIAIEGVGSGSGLLDLTRESDDTSLGAEVLDHIDMEDAVGSGLEPQRPTLASIPDIAMIEPPTYVEAVDAAGGAFGGLIIGASIVMFVLGAVMLAAMLQKVPEFLTALKENVMGVVVGGVVVILIATVAGYIVGKSSAQRAALMKQTNV